MDIDCDGVQNGTGNDGRCGSSDDTQSMTAFLDTVKRYKQGIADLNPFVHPYVVFGNVGSNGANEASFEPQAHGIEPLSIMAVVCGNNMVSAPENKAPGKRGLYAPSMQRESLTIAVLRHMGRRERRL